VFSHRVPADLRQNALAAAVARARGASRPILDLTSTNPTTVGLPYPADLLSPLADARSCRYQPAPLGLPDARAAVARDFARRGLHVDASRIVLTSSTSEAYSVLFKLLCDPADDVLVPEPSYPLFTHLTRLDAVRAVPYRLEYHGVWSIDRESLASAWSERTRAVLVVSPNNPTGSMLRADDLRWLLGECASRGAAIVSDEVFADYAIDPAADAVTSVLGEGPRGTGVLRFALGGLSKSAGLPQVKVGWMALDGPPAQVGDALARLELICDTYLSVSTPAQAALPALIDAGASIREAIAARVAANHELVRATVARFPACTALRIEGGWAAVVRVPARVSEDALVQALVEHDGVLVHPGYFFDFPHEAFVVVSLLTPTNVLAAGLELVLKRAEG
jgi:alanine-synthesizing transaminase